MANRKKRRRSNGAEETVNGEVELDAEGNPIVSGESEDAPTLGGAIDAIAYALKPFDDVTRKRIVRAAHMMLK